MGSSVKLRCEKKVVRGSYRELKKYCKDKNIANKYIKQDETGYYLVALDRGRFHKRK